MSWNIGITNSERQYYWTYTECKNYFDVLRLVPKLKETVLKLKHPGYHNLWKVLKLNEDF